MPISPYKGSPLSDKGILAAFDAGRYLLVDNKITLPNGKALYTYTGKDSAKHLFVRIHYRNRRRGVAVHRVIWIVSTRSTIPSGWEVHHRDLDPTNNRFDNLFCLHPLDHRKLHKGLIVEDTSFDPETF